MPLCTRCHREVPTGGLFCSFCGAGVVQAAPDAPSDPYIGQTLSGKYFVHQLLGRGGMGEVYKATHLTLDRPVVLKLLRKSLLDDPSIVQRFHREARAASRLNHPNSVNIIDFGQTDDGVLFIAMEYLSGRSLARAIADEHPIDEARVAHVGAQILAALGEAHALGVIHRDLKPENVMLESRRDEPDHVKVLDFGIAQFNEPGASEGTPRLTQAGMVCGTPGYMSPEQIRGDAIDARSDLYAVGVILYEMLTGKLPFEADTPMGLVTKSLVEPPMPLRERSPDLVVSPALEAIVLRALERDPAARFSSADEMRAELLSLEVRPARPLRATPLGVPRSTVFLGAADAPAQEQAPEAPRTAFLDVGAPRPPTGPHQKQRPHATPPPAAPQAARPATPRPARSATPAPKPAPAVAPPTPPPAAPEEPRPATGRRAQPTPHPRAKQPAPTAAPRASRVPLVAGVAVAVLVLGGLVAYGLTRKAATQPPPASPLAAAPSLPAPAPSPPPASPEPAPQPITAEPAPSNRPEPVPAPQETALVAPKPPADDAAKQEPAAPSVKVEPRQARPRGTKGVRLVREVLNSIPTPASASGDGVLAVVAVPWALVTIDGQEVGETPREVRLGAGSYRIRAKHPELGMREETVKVAAGQRKLWTATFAR